MRLNNYLARAGIASRRKSEKLILNGEVSVNGRVITNLGTNINLENDLVTINDKPIRLPKIKYYALNKPEGYTTTRKDKFAKKTIFELLPKDPTLYAVGRLDRETTGLILITNDGQFGQKIIHPKNKIEKEYLVESVKPFDDLQLTNLKKGVNLNDGLATAKSIKKIKNFKILLTIEEGRNKIVRRMIKAVGNEVKKLERVRIGEIKLDIKKGEFRELKKEEVKNYV